MPNYNTHLKAKRGEVLLDMFADDGVTAPGEAPPAEYLEAVRGSTTVDEVDEVRAAHAEGRGPPPRGENRGNGNSGGAGNGNSGGG